jgi:hypothetical protein
MRELGTNVGESEEYAQSLDRHRNFKCRSEIGPIAGNGRVST